METEKSKTKVSLSYENDTLFLWYQLDNGEGKSVKVTNDGISIVTGPSAKSKSYTLVVVGEDEVETFLSLLNAVIHFSTDKEWFIETYITPANKVDDESEQGS